ncbi:NAD-dependent epimerase/dehydratase family protein [Muriicola soli]|uniref:NAD-dependent epimerase/dehydratase family protein n=1 Tax=Muriicola soli TaxID=2507538 RepID=A0A411E884_9FLAO|nr:NAD-dependent epimerase/dehydratase family protein [Muriicola soli]QBA63899.1 NAD-dependent epimerase/dehydratase family protein [Muriicola soli]
MKILVTGAAGFIGFHLCKVLLEKGHDVVGLDNINDYYDVELKHARLSQLGIDKKKSTHFNNPVNSERYKDKFLFLRMHLEDRTALPQLFQKEKFEIVCNMAAQAGVRYSLENPDTYVDSNVVGFLNVLECCRHEGIKNLIYASSSSVYGDSSKVPFTENEQVDKPISLYAATKKSNELMAHTYSHLYGIMTTGLRFFTVYGPWGRPDMALFLFTEAILKGKSIEVFNNGLLERDFTYIDDIVGGVMKVIESDLNSDSKGDSLYKVYNIGNGQPVKLTDFIEVIEKILDKKAIKNMMPMQPGDVTTTWADLGNLKQDFDYSPNTGISVGVRAFIEWYRNYYHL